jgi:SsrA-binding protein
MRRPSQQAFRLGFEVSLMAPAKTQDKDAVESIARNKRARYDYEILETWEAGLVLQGSEVKSLRAGQAAMGDSFGIVREGEVFLVNLHIAPYSHGGNYNHEPTRTRKLLMHRSEIRKLIGAVERKGLTLVPLELYFREGRAKVRIALARGKQEHDRRDDIRKRDAEREVARTFRARH